VSCCASTCPANLKSSLTLSSHHPCKLSIVMDGNSRFDLLRLPSEIQTLVVSKLPCVELVRLSTTCRSMHTLINNPKLDETYVYLYLSTCAGQKRSYPGARNARAGTVMFYPSDRVGLPSNGNFDFTGSGRISCLSIAYTFIHRYRSSGVWKMGLAPRLRQLLPTPSRLTSNYLAKWESA
jgi:hypothetical protein